MEDHHDRMKRNITPICINDTPTHPSLYPLPTRPTQNNNPPSRTLPPLRIRKTKLKKPKSMRKRKLDKLIQQYSRIQKEPETCTKPRVTQKTSLAPRLSRSYAPTPKQSRL